MNPTSRAPKKNTFPQEVKTANSLHVIIRNNSAAPAKVRVARSTPVESRDWMSKPITFDHLDYSRSIRNAGWTALILDPIIDGLQFTQVLMDGGSDINLLYQDTIRRMGIDPTKIRHSNTSFKGVTPGLYANCTGSVLLEVVFGSFDNLHHEKLIFHIAPFKSSHQALLGREAFARFNAIPHYASLTLKMPGPRGIISLKGNIECSSSAEDCVTTLTATH